MEKLAKLHDLVYGGELIVFDKGFDAVGKVPIAKPIDFEEDVVGVPPGLGFSKSNSSDEVSERFEDLEKSESGGEKSTS